MQKTIKIEDIQLAIDICKYLGASIAVCELEQKLAWLIKINEEKRGRNT